MRFPSTKEATVCPGEDTTVVSLSQGEDTTVVFPGKITGNYSIPRNFLTKCAHISFKETSEGVVCEGTVKKERHSIVLEKMSTPVLVKTVVRGEIVPDGLSTILACVPTMSKDEYRKNLCCVRLDASSESNGHVGHIVSTDGHRITWVKADVKHSLTISAEAVNLIHANQKDVQDIYHSAAGVVVVLNDGVEIHCPDQNHIYFPAWPQVVPSQLGFKWNTSINRDVALDALKKYKNKHKVFADENMILSVIFYEDKLVLHTTKDGADSNSEDPLTILSGLPAGPSVHVGINLQYLMDALSVFDDDVVVQGGDALSVVQISSLPYGFTGETSPIRVGIMPMRV